MTPSHPPTVRPRQDGLLHAADEVLMYERILPALPATIGRVREELDDGLACLDVAGARRADIALVVTEATTNAVLHAYLDMDPGPVYVTAAVSARAVLATVHDWGRGMLPRRDTPGLGFGVVIMRTLADDVQIGPNESDVGTRVALLFRDAAPAVGAAAVAHPRFLAGDDTGTMREYVQALAETSAGLCEDARALHAEASHAVARARRLCARRSGARP